MLTVHAADVVLTPGGPAGAVLVDGGVIADLGSLEAVTAAWPRARVRRWPGVMAPGLVNHRAAALLEETYHPDPREADPLGTEPISGEKLTALALDDGRWGASARRGLQRMLQLGTTAVTGPFARPTVRTAVARSGLRLREPGPGAEPGAVRGAGTGAQSVTAAVTAAGPAPALDVLAALPPDAALGPLLDGELAVGHPADLAVFDVPAEPVARLAADVPVGALPVSTLRPHGATTCVATVLGGRLVYRRR